MSLLTSEIHRIKQELGYNLLAVGAEPYIGVAAIFEQVIQPYTTSGASTTSATAVTAATTPTAVSVTLASVTGFAAGDHVIVDVDSLQERATIRSVSGSTISVALSNAHTGTYPVTVEGGESIIREILRHLAAIASSSAVGGVDAMTKTVSKAGLKRVDEVELFGGSSVGTDAFAQLKKMREYWRDELASALGIVRLNGANSGGASVAVY